MRKIVFEMTLDNDNWTDDQYRSQEELYIEVDIESLREFLEEQATRQGKLPKGCYIEDITYSIQN